MIYSCEKCVFAKCTQIMHLLSFASFFFNDSTTGPKKITINKWAGEMDLGPFLFKNYIISEFLLNPCFLETRLDKVNGAHLV